MEARALTGEVRVRMYNVGFGDCFLVTFAGERHMLIDCGTHPIASAKQPIERVIEDIIAATAGRIDVVVATHRHADHISGFASDAWDRVSARQVWLPWTENPNDAAAGEIRAQQEKTAGRLALSTSDDVMRLAMNARPNARALHRLLHGFARAERKFLGSGDRLDDVLGNGVSVVVLGPSRDERVIREMTPPPDQRYLADGAAPEQARPAFPSQYEVAAPARTLVTDFDVRILGSIPPDDEIAAAVRLDAAINGTSLVLAIVVGGTVLVFAGDAQWGTWKVAVGDSAARQLLAASAFLKISHHGSHNGTPPALLDAMPALEIAAVSTRATTFGWDIPREPLLRELRDRHVAVGRLDTEYTPSRFARGPGNLYLETFVAIDRKDV